MSLERLRPIVSIIMPVYNAKEYIETAIASVLQQSYREIELIIIDDGSSDGSIEICNKIAQLDSRVKLIHQKNHGLCYSRNRGIEAANGEFIAFADHDDEYLPSSIEHMVNIFQSSHVDLVKGSYIGEIVDCNDKSKEYKALMPTCKLDINELVNQYKFFNYSIRAMWNGMYKSNIIKDNNIFFDESLQAGAEDYNFNLTYLSKIDTIALTEFRLYKHYIRIYQSASVGYNENRQKGIKKAYHTEACLLKKLSISSETYIDHQLWYFYMLVREHCFDDTPYNNKEIDNRLVLFLNEMESIKTIPTHDIFHIIMRDPKKMIKWEAVRRKKVDYLYRHYKKTKGWY